MIGQETPDGRIGMLWRYTPAMAILLTLALFVAAVPSRTPQVETSGVDILDGSGPEPETVGVDERLAVDADDAQDGDGGASAGPGGAGESAVGGGGTPNAGATARPGPSAGSTSGGPASSGPPTGNGPGNANVAGADCSRQKIADNLGCRPPKWSGDNGGATYRGVSGDKIRVVAYQVRQNEQVNAILAAAGTATNAQREAAFRAIVKWVNANVELHGRQIEPIFYVGTTPANDAAGQQADAVHVAEKLNAFAVLTLYPAPIFHEELHRRGVPNFTWNQFPAAWFESMSPHTFGLFPDRDLTLAHVAEYVCKRVLQGAANPNPNATHAGDPTYRNTPRKFGVIYQDATDNGPFLANLMKQRCGKVPAKMLSYPADIGNAVAISTNAVTQMQQEGITTVTCICDVIAPVFFTGQATKQGWYPEWIHNGYFVTDANGAGRLYEPSQWRNSFGVSTLSYPSPVAQTSGYRACRAGGGDNESCVKGQSGYWSFLAVLGAAIEANGPRLTDVNVARSIVSLPAITGTNPADPRYSFGNNGPSPYTYIDNTMEIWYDPTRQGNDGEAGAAYYVDAGRRYNLGDWPTTAPRVFVDDGSPQPPRDPDL